MPQSQCNKTSQVLLIIEEQISLNHFNKIHTLHVNCLFLDNWVWINGHLFCIICLYSFSLQYYQTFLPMIHTLAAHIQHQVAFVILTPCLTSKLHRNTVSLCLSKWMMCFWYFPFIRLNSIMSRGFSANQNLWNSYNK